MRQYPRRPYAQTTNPPNALHSTYSSIKKGQEGEGEKRKREEGRWRKIRKKNKNKKREQRKRVVLVEIQGLACALLRKAHQSHLVHVVLGNLRKRGGGNACR